MIAIKRVCVNAKRYFQIFIFKKIAIFENVSLRFFTSFKNVVKFVTHEKEFRVKPKTKSYF